MVYASVTPAEPSSPVAGMPFLSAFLDVNIAPTDLLPLTVIEQELPATESQADQPPKLDPADGTASNATTVPCVKFAWHVEPQFIPVGLLVTMPPPFPILLSVN